MPPMPRMASTSYFEAMRNPGCRQSISRDRSCSQWADNELSPLQFGHQRIVLDCCNSVGDGVFKAALRIDQRLYLNTLCPTKVQLLRDPRNEKRAAVTCGRICSVKVPLIVG